MNRTFLSLFAIAACLAIFLAVNIVGMRTLRGARVDLTENRLYTLSEGSRQIAKKIDEPIRLTLYFSEKQANGLPEIKSYATRVREFLQEYANASGGKIKVEVVDPEPFSEAEDRAVQAQLYGAQVGPSQRIYFGLVGTNSTGQEQVIPFFDARKEQFLEYDIARLVYLLSNPQKKTIGMMASLPINGVEDNPLMRGQNTPPWQVAAQLRELFDVRNIPADTAEIPADINVLMVVHPKSLKDATLYAIDQFVMRGGRLMVFVDPWCESDLPPGINPMQALQLPKASNLNRLFSAWGFEMVPDKFAADRNLAIRVPTGSQSQPELVSAVYLLDLRRDQQCLNSGDATTGQLEHVTMGIAGILHKKPEADITFEPLIQTTSTAQAVDVAQVQMIPDAKRLLAEFKSEDRVLTLAARISGKLKSAFPDGDPTAGEENPAATHLAESAEPANIVVVADCDMLTDRYWVQEMRLGNISLGYQKFADNGDLIIGLADQLSGSSDLISLRARATAARPFKKVEAIRKAAEQQYLAEEQKLREELARAENKLSEILRQAPQGGSVILTPEQQAELDKSRREVVRLKKELRNVNHQLRKDIESLGTRLKFLNIAVVPLAVSLAAVGLSVYRVNRRRSYKARPTART